MTHMTKQYVFFIQSKAKASSYS